MSLLKTIEIFDRDAARVLKEADLRSDWDIRTLTREDLNELFPGPKKLKLRRTIYERIHKQKPIDEIMRDLKGFIPREVVRDALTEYGVLVDYLRLLKDLKGQMNEVAGFLDAHIRLLEEFRKNQPDSVSDPGTSDSVQTDDQQQDKQGSVSDPGTSDSVQPDDQQDKQGSVSDPGTSDSMQTDDQPQGEPFIDLSEQGVTVKYRTVVSGKTLDADKQLMEKVKKNQRQDGVQFVESSDDHKVNILFCPISSRIGSDIDAAMSDVKDIKPVILVLMHHERQPRFVSAGTWNSKHENVEMRVHVYYHDTVPGLIPCRENDDAVLSIQKKLLDYSPLTCQNTSGNAQGMGAESGRDSSISSNGGGYDRHSDDDSGSSFFGVRIPKSFPKFSQKEK